METDDDVDEADEAYKVDEIDGLDEVGGTGEVDKEVDVDVKVSELLVSTNVVDRSGGNELLNKMVVDGMTRETEVLDGTVVVDTEVLVELLDGSEVIDVVVMVELVKNSIVVEFGAVEEDKKIEDVEDDETDVELELKIADEMTSVGCHDGDGVGTDGGHKFLPMSGPQRHSCTALHEHSSPTPELQTGALALGTQLNSAGEKGQSQSL